MAIVRVGEFVLEQCSLAAWKLCERKRETMNTSCTISIISVTRNFLADLIYRKNNYCRGNGFKSDRVVKLRRKRDIVDQGGARIHRLASKEPADGAVRKRFFSGFVVSWLDARAQTFVRLQCDILFSPGYVYIYI